MQESSPAIKQAWLRVILFFIAFVAISITFQASYVLIIQKGILPQVGKENSAYFLLKNAAFTFIGGWLTVYVFRKWIDRQSIKSLGFEWKGYATHGFTGTYAAISILLTGTLFLLGMNNILFLGIDFNIKKILLFLFVMALTAVGEELVVRGYMLHNLMKCMPKWVALLLSALIFSLLHIFNDGSSVFSIIGVFTAGILLGINYIYTGNLWFGIFFHFVWNFVLGPILGYKVSGLETDAILPHSTQGANWLTGGNFGFEASIVCILLNVLMLCILVIIYNKKLSQNLNVKTTSQYAN